METLKKTRAEFYEFLFQQFGEEATTNKTRKKIKKFLIKITNAALNEKNNEIKKLRKALSKNKKTSLHKKNKKEDPRKKIRFVKYF